MGNRKKHVQENPWDRKPSETPRQYQMFCAYLEMNTAEKPIRTRNLLKLTKEIEFSYDYLRRLSSTHDWVSRAAAYDAYLATKIREKSEEDIIDMRKNHALLAAQMIRKATKRLLTMPEDDITASDIVRLVDVGVKIERLSRGESTENKQISGEAKVTHQGEIKLNQKSPGDLNLSCLSDEEIAELEQLLAKLHTEPDV